MLTTARLIACLFAVFTPVSAAMAVPAPCLPPGCVAFPADAGALNVRDFGAKGDGVADDTAAINKALAASGDDTGPAFWQDRIVYFPSGTYLVSAPIVKRYAEGRFASGAILVGQSRDTTIIRLKDVAAGYNDPAHPKAVIFTAAKLLDGNATSGGKDYTNKGEGNDAFMNFVENMTVDVGASNPGAIGIDYLANNMGAIRNVLVKAPAGSGITGIALTRKWPGPALLQDITVEGFDTGIDIGNTEYGVTLESIRLKKQTTGLRNDHNVVSAYDLQIMDAKLPVHNVSPDGLVMIGKGILKQPAAGGEAIRNAGILNVRELDTQGYKTVFGAVSTGIIDGVFKENNRISTSQADWSLPVQNPPPVAADAPESWVSVGAVDSNVDATEAIRKAFASGASTIYFPHGTYLISDNIVVPASVQRIVGMTSTIHAFPERQQSFRRDLGMFRTMNDAAPLVIEKLAFDNSYLGDQVAVEVAGTGPVVLRDITGAGVTTLLRPEKGGEAFLENTCCGMISVAGSKGVWARQLDTEGGGVRIRNSGAPLWILGLKTEKNCTVLENTAGATTEILGGLIYITGNTADPAIPAFRNTDSKLWLSYAEESFDANATYAVHLENTKGGKTNTTAAESLPMRTIGRMVPVLVAQ